MPKNKKTRTISYVSGQSIVAEEQGFEPWRGLYPLSVFETDPFSRLGIPPVAIIISFSRIVSIFSLYRNVFST